MEKERKLGNTHMFFDAEINQNTFQFVFNHTFVLFKTASQN